MRRRRTAAALLAVCVTAALTGCAGTDEPPAPEALGAAEPGDSPAPEAEPAGRVVELEPQAEGLAYDAVTDLLVATVREENRLLLIDGATGRIEREVPLPGHARHLQLAAPGGPVLVPAEDSDTLVLVSLPDGGTTEVEVGEYPHDAAQVEGGRILVADELGGTLSVVQDDEVVQTFDSQSQPGGIAAVGPLAGVVDVADFTLSIYDVVAGELSTVVDAGEGPTHLVTDVRDRFLVADTRGDAILVFGADPLRPASSYELPGTPYGVAHDDTAQVLWVTLTARNEVVGLSTAGERLTEVARFPTVRQPNTVTVDPDSGRVFVASRATGELQLIDPGPLAEGAG
jgi:DNA-binding beta-propeller fold protein YncE